MRRHVRNLTSVQQARGGIRGQFGLRRGRRLISMGLALAFSFTALTVEINDPGAYRYVPTFAALLAPLTVVPEVVLTWIYRAACILCLRYLVGSWKAVGWALVFPPVLIELWSLNLTLPLAAGARWALRGGGSGALPAQSALKYSSTLLLPYLWITRPATRRALLIGGTAAVAVVLVHAILDPEAWRLFAESLVQQSRSTNDAPYIGDQLLFILPSTMGDFLLRFAVGAAMTVIAIRKRWDWLVFTAVLIAAPTLWLARLAPLVAVPRLLLEDVDARRLDRSMGRPIQLGGDRP